MVDRSTRHAVALSLLVLLAPGLTAPAALAQTVDDGLVAAQQGDLAGAVAIWTPLAEAGQAEAQYRLGFAHAGGWGVPEDQARAAAWYARAADQGHAPAFVQLGHMHADGRHFARNEAQAAAWFRRAADAGNADGRYYLGHAHYQGRGVPRDIEKALHLWQLAAAQRHEGARLDLCDEKPEFCNR